MNTPTPLGEQPSPTPQPSVPGPERLENQFARFFAGQHGIRAGWRWLIFLGIFVACAAGLLVAAVAAHFFSLHGPQPSAQSFTASRVLMQEGILVIAMFLAAATMSKIERRPMGEYGLPASAAFGRQFWTGAGWGMVAVSTMMLLIAALRGFTFGSVALPARAIVGYALIWAIAFLLTSLAEEFLFRGYSQFTLASGMGFWPAAIFLSLLFGGLHLRNTGESWAGGLAAGYIGLFFCFTLWRTGNIWFSVGLHAAWDYGETFVFGVPDSGFAAPGHLINSSLHGAPWLTGGKVGPEASAACFVVISLMFLVFHLTYRARVQTRVR